MHVSPSGHSGQRKIKISTRRPKKVVNLCIPPLEQFRPAFLLTVSAIQYLPPLRLLRLIGIRHTLCHDAFQVEITYCLECRFAFPDDPIELLEPVASDDLGE